MFADAPAARIISRRGIGNVRRLDTSHLWIREVVAKKAVELKQIIGICNVAGLVTKELDAADIDKYMHLLGAVYQDGRAELAARVAIGEVKVTTNADGEFDVIEADEGHDRPGEAPPATQGPVIAKVVGRLASENGAHEEQTGLKAVGHFKVQNDYKEVRFIVGSEMFTLARHEERKGTVEETQRRSTHKDKERDDDVVG